ncbi:divalent-cation tolerance protein CutA [Candidatus Woesebacteria bacterium]|nr:divalent-cation tolerance protein CutA [Candidatus Woesebacteria bacterium]
MNMVLLFLACADDEEAEKISQSLLKKRLIVCAKKTPVSSAFFWKRKIDKANEVLLVMETIEENFEEIEKEVRKIHSYETFVLSAIPVVKYSKGVAEWLKEGLKK